MNMLCCRHEIILVLFSCESSFKIRKGASTAEFCFESVLYTKPIKYKLSLYQFISLAAL